MIMQEDTFWLDKNKAQDIIQELKKLKETITKFTTFSDKIKIIQELLDISLPEDLEDINKDLIELKREFQNLELLTLLNEQYDTSDAILEIHAGAGGTESCDWALMLYRMYSRWCDSKGYKIEQLDYQEGEETGIKSISLMVKGLYAYGYLKNEKGIHRLVRLSPFDSNNRRHTSFASVEVMPKIEDVKDIIIDDKDLKIDVYRSSGAGGQHVNTTDSAVRITHLPTKTVVTCQNERSQIKNKEKALKLLKNKLKIMEIKAFEEGLNEIKGTQKNIEFGSQIRSYIMHPYSLVKDHRTNVETSNVQAILDGNIDIFIDANLKRKGNYEKE